MSVKVTANKEGDSPYFSFLICLDLDFVEEFAELKNGREK